MAAYKRRIFVINPKFQLKFSFLICFLFCVASVYYPITLLDVLEKFIQHVSLTDPLKTEKLVNYKNTLIIVLLLFQVGFTALFFIICIFISHKVAGPMFKLQKFLASVRDGEQCGKLYFRKGDYFPEVADDLNDTFDSIREQYENDFVYLSEVNTYLKNLSMVVPEDKKIVLSEISAKLDEMQGRFNKK